MHRVLSLLVFIGSLAIVLEVLTTPRMKISRSGRSNIIGVGSAIQYDGYSTPPLRGKRRRWLMSFNKVSLND